MVHLMHNIWCQTHSGVFTDPTTTRPLQLLLTNSAMVVIANVLVKLLGRWGVNGYNDDGGGGGAGRAILYNTAVSVKADVDM